MSLGVLAGPSVRGDAHGRDNLGWCQGCSGMKRKRFACQTCDGCGRNMCEKHIAWSTKDALFLCRRCINHHDPRIRAEDQRSA